MPSDARCAGGAAGTTWSHGSFPEPNETHGNRPGWHRRRVAEETRNDQMDRGGRP